MCGAALRALIVSRHLSVGFPEVDGEGVNERGFASDADECFARYPTTRTPCVRLYPARAGNSRMHFGVSRLFKKDIMV